VPRTSDNGWDPNIARLSADPGFLALKRQVEEARERRLVSLTKDVISEKGLSEAQRHYERGYFAAMRRLFDIPEIHKEELSE
jgi:hypothetical protein